MRKLCGKYFKIAVCLVLVFAQIYIAGPNESYGKTSIYIDASVRTVMVGGTMTMKLQGTNQKPVWSSGNTKIADINKSTGILSAKNTGKATIEASLAGKKYQLTITVVNDQELIGAIKNGFVPSSLQEDYNKPVTFAEYCTIASNMLQKYQSPLVDKWKKTAKNALNNKKVMKREDALLADFMLAVIMNQNRYNTHEDDAQYKMDTADRQFTYDYPFAGWETPVHLYFAEGNPDGEAFPNYLFAALYYNVRRESILSNKLMLEAKKDKTFDFTSPLTRMDAILAIVRLYDSVGNLKPRYNEDADILKLAGKRIKDIKEDKTEIKATGRVYFISNQGNDTADGLTGRTAWNTLDKVNSYHFMPGDMVLFERGDIWRGQLRLQEGVTYSAYGTGDKPSIYGSPEDAASPEKWSLLKGTKNIWVFYRDVEDCGTLVFNGGEAYGIKEVPYYINGRYVTAEDKSKAFSAQNNLNTDLSFFTPADSVIKDGLPYLGDLTGMEQSSSKGKLYLRCDKGNPGKIFKSIELLVRENLVIPDDHAVVNNLCFKYCGGHALFSGDNNLTVENCEFGWIGGTVQEYLKESGAPGRYGNAIEFDGQFDSCTAKNNYIYQVFDAGLSNQGGNERRDETITSNNITYEGNVVQYCSYSIEIFYNYHLDKYTKPAMRNVLINDNLIMYSGSGFSTQRNEPYNGSGIMMWSYDNPSENFKVTNNIFYVSTGNLFYMRIDPKYYPNMYNNTYIQYFGGGLGSYRNGNGIAAYYAGYNTDSFLKNVIKDKKGSIKILNLDTK